MRLNRQPTDPSIIRRLAHATAWGYKQKSLINELLAGPVTYYSNFYGVRVGMSRVEWASYRNLRNRLVDAGFVFEMVGESDYRNRNGKPIHDYRAGTITMSFPEA